MYTVGGADLAVSSIDFSVNHPVDPLGFNDFATYYSTPANIPGTTTTLQFLSGATWTTITDANYLTTGVVGLSSTPCMKSGTLDGTSGASTFSFTMSCTDNTKFGTTPSGEDNYELRYMV